MRFARVHSRYYADLYRELPEKITGVEQLPVVTKSELMARFDDWVTDPEVTKAAVETFAAEPTRVGERFLGRYTVWTTSGATGTPALLVQDEQALAVMTSLAWVRAVPAWIGLREICAFLARGVRGAIVFATGGHFMALTMAERVRRSSAWMGKHGEVISVLTPIPEMVKKLNELDPTVLASYASGLALLAEEQAAGRLAINPVLITSTGESLTLLSRQRVEAAFKQRVRETYGASEIQIAAFECRRGRLHLNSDWVILEPVDSNHQPVPPGVPSRTVLATSLSNRVQPIIRYDLGDSITVFADPCRCGSPLPAIRVEGRSDEILSFRSQSGDDVHLLPAALTTSIAGVPGVQRFQLIGKGSAKLLVRLQAHDGTDADEVWAAASESLRKVLVAHGLRNVAIERSPETPTARSKSGKVRQVWAEPLTLPPEAYPV